MAVFVIEGVDGAGKSEVAKHASEKFNRIKTLNTSRREDMMPEVRKVLNKNVERSVESRFVYYLALNQMVDNEIKANPGKDYIKERSIYSTKAYHVAYDIYYNKGANLGAIEELYNAALKSAVKPDLTVFLYVDEAERLKRLMRRDPSKNTPNDFESDIMKYAEGEFRNIAKALRKDGISVLEIDTTDISKEAVAKTVSDAIMKHMLLERESKI